MPLLRRLIAIFQIYGGIAGGFATLNNILNGNLVGGNAILGFLAFLFYLIAVIGGVMLLECKELGRQLSRAVQAFTIPHIFFGFVQYQLINGAIYAITVSSDVEGFIRFDWAITSQWSLVFNGDQALGFGINVIALFSFIVLGYSRITKYK